MRRLLAVVVLLASTAWGQANTTAAIPNPCQNPAANLIGVNLSTSGTAAVQIVALAASQKIYLCSLYVVGVSGTSPTFSLVYGTGSNCVTGQAVFLGSWSTAASTVYQFNGTTVGIVPASQALCYLDTGTTPVQRVLLTYVQQ
jgi:hypothetical protein